MANTDNLIPNEERTPSERRENARKAGKASGEARRRKKAMRQAASELLNMNLSGSKHEGIAAIKQRLQALGYDAEDATIQDAVLVSVMMKALKGDVRASEFLRDTAGANPALDIKKEELKLKKAALKLRQEESQRGGGNSEGVQIIDDIPAD